MRYLSVVMAAALLGCSRDLDHRHAAEAIRRHLVSVAPAVVKADDLQVDVREIILPEEHSREVRFRLVWLYRDTSGAVARDTGRITSVIFHRSDKGWALARYGETFLPVVAALVAAQWQSEFAELLEPLESLRREAFDWATARLDAATSVGTTMASVARSLQAFNEYLVGIPEQQLRQRVAEKRIVLPENIQWGVSDAWNESISRVLWVRLASDTTVMCAVRLGSNAPPAEFYWVEENGETCRGRGRHFNTLKARDEAAAAISKLGGVILND